MSQACPTIPPNGVRFRSLFGIVSLLILVFLAMFFLNAFKLRLKIRHNNLWEFPVRLFPGFSVRPLRGSQVRPFRGSHVTPTNSSLRSMLPLHSSGSFLSHIVAIPLIPLNPPSFLFIVRLLVVRLPSNTARLLITPN